MNNCWQQKTKQSLRQQGDDDYYNLGTSLLIPDKKEISERVLPIIINTIEKHNNHSGRPLQLQLSKSTTMQRGIRLVLVVVGPLPGHNCPTSPTST